MNSLHEAREAEHRAIDLRYAALERLAAASSEGTYSAARLPPNTTRRTFYSWCRKGRVAGAVADGRGWACPVASWRAARASTKVAPPKLRLVAADIDIDALADETIAGIREKRQARR